MLESQLTCPHISDFEVLNFAFTGYDIEYALERLNLRAIPLKPDLLIWNINKNDLTERSEFIYEYIHENGYQAMTDNDDHEFWRRVWDEADQSMRIEFTSSEIEAYQIDALKRLRDGYQKELVLLASNHTKTSIMTDTKYFSLVHDAASSTDAHYVEVNDPRLRENATFPDGHLNPLGHTMVAERLFAYVARNLLTECTFALEAADKKGINDDNVD